MSWILGTDNTSFGSDIGALWTNATTGNLSQSQKNDIATNATQQLTDCKNNPTSANCIALENSNQGIVDAVAKSDECDGVLNLPGFGCVQSWNSVIYGALLIVGIMFAAYFVILFNPRRIVNA